MCSYVLKSFNVEWLTQSVLEKVRIFLVIPHQQIQYTKFTEKHNNLISITRVKSQSFLTMHEVIYRYIFSLFINHNWLLRLNDIFKQSCCQSLEKNIVIQAQYSLVFISIGMWESTKYFLEERSF